MYPKEKIIFRHYGIYRDNFETYYLIHALICPPYHAVDCVIPIRAIQKFFHHFMYIFQGISSQK